MKLSLHGDKGSLVCQMALTTEFYTSQAAALGEKRPSVMRWRRAPTPSDRLLHVVSLQFPVDYVRGRPKEGTPEKPLLVFEGQRDEMVEIGLFYSRLSGERAEALLSRGSTPLGFFALDNGDNVFVAGRRHPFKGLRLPDGQHLGPPGNVHASTVANSLVAGRHLRIGEQMQNATVLMHDEPSDGKGVALIEIGGVTVTRHA